MFFLDMSLSYDSVVHYYLGNPEEFRQPRSYAGMLEVAHFHLFSMGILILTLVHLMLFALVRDRTRHLGIWLPFGFAVANEGAGWLVRFVDPVFAYFKMATFVGLEMSLLWVMVVIVWGLAGRPGHRSGDGRAPRQGTAAGQ